MTESSKETAVATRKGPMTIEQLFEHPSSRAYIEPYLPKGTDIQRVVAAVQMAIKNDDSGKLGQCTAESLVLGVARIHSWQLELGVNAYLLPFKNKAVPVAGYQGLIELIVGSRAVRHIEAREVREGDEFEYHYGLEGTLYHKPLRKKSTAPITHVYIIIHLPGGSKAFDVMTAADVEAIRQQFSKSWKEGPLTAWYAKKTIIRQASKLLPKDPRLALFMRVMDEDELTIEETIDPVQPAAVDDGEGGRREPGEEG